MLFKYKDTISCLLSGWNRCVYTTGDDSKWGLKNKSR